MVEAEEAPKHEGAPKLEFEPWYRAEYPRVVRVLLLIGRDRESALDAASEAFTRALKHWDRVRTMRSPSAWTYTVGLNVLRRQLRRAAAERHLWRKLPKSEQIDATQLQLWDVLSALPLREREAVVLYYLLDLPQHQVAEVMRVKPGTVAATLYAARNRLRSAIGPDLEEEVTDRA
jgi:RNA polymerase sigma-70 factor, ECF subfamily